MERNNFLEEVFNKLPPSVKWIAKNPSGKWFGYSKKPEKISGKWIANNWVFPINMEKLNDWEISWDKSLRARPAREIPRKNEVLSLIQFLIENVSTQKIRIYEAAEIMEIEVEIEKSNDEFEIEKIFGFLIGIAVSAKLIKRSEIWM